MNADDRQTVHQRLLQNADKLSAEHRKEIEAWEPVLAGGKHFLQGYAPYIGEAYFGSRTQGRRILAYALSQNIAEQDEFAVEWATNPARGLDRQNIAWRECGKAAMNPFDTGHIPILASLLRRIIPGHDPGAEESIYTKIAATNLSKFSFRTKDKRQTTDAVKSLECCWQWFSRLEVELLRPDYVVCCDPRILKVVVKGLKGPGLFSASDGLPRPILVSFPSIRVINRHYRKPLRVDHYRLDQLEGMVAATDLDMHVCRGSQLRMTLRERIREDAYYFNEMLTRMQQQIGLPSRSV